MVYVIVVVYTMVEMGSIIVHMGSVKDFASCSESANFVRSHLLLWKHILLSRVYCFIIFYRTGGYFGLVLSLLQSLSFSLFIILSLNQTSQFFHTCTT